MHGEGSSCGKGREEGDREGTEGELGREGKGVES